MSIFATDFEASLAPLCVERGVRAKIAGWTIPHSDAIAATAADGSFAIADNSGDTGGFIGIAWNGIHHSGSFTVGVRAEDGGDYNLGLTGGEAADAIAAALITLITPALPDCTLTWDSGAKRLHIGTDLTGVSATVTFTGATGIFSSATNGTGTDAVAEVMSNENSLAVFCPGVPNYIAWPNIANLLGNATSVAWSGGDAVSRIEIGWWDGSTFTRLFYIAGSQPDGTPDKWADGNFPSPLPAAAVGAALALRIVYDSGSIAANFSGGTFEAIMTMHYFRASS